MEYAEGHGQTTVTIEPRTLTIELSANPSIIVSEASSIISILVTSDTAPIQDATVTISSDLGGTFSATTGTTDQNGNVSFIFTAPLIPISDGSIANVTVTASKDGYVNCEAQVRITVIPRLLVVQTLVEPATTTSEAITNATVHVVYAQDMSSVPDANVTLVLLEVENFSISGVTDLNGNVKLTFNAPPVNTSTDFTVSVVASKIGYIAGQNLSTITVNPGILNVQIRPSTQAVTSGGTAAIEIHVTNDANASIANASVTMIMNYTGNSSEITKLSNADGLCSFILNAPETPIQISVVITANATKNGYIGAGDRTIINVTPPPPPSTGGGLPFTTILMIIIPIVIVVIIVVLIKLKIISVSDKEED
jgi:hypothetical protein